jgi:hypothetical protein
MVCEPTKRKKKKKLNEKAKVVAVNGTTEATEAHVRGQLVATGGLWPAVSRLAWSVAVGLFLR